MLFRSPCWICSSILLIVDTESLKMYKTVPSPTEATSYSIFSQHTVWMMKRKRTRHPTPPPLLQVCPTLWITGLTVCVSLVILLTTALPAGQKGKHHQHVLKYVMFFSRVTMCWFVRYELLHKCSAASLLHIIVKSELHITGIVYYTNSKQYCVLHIY